MSFMAYGASCLTTGHMVREFERYGLPQYRQLTGILQLLGAIGLLAGLWLPLIGAVAAGGLALQMLVGFGVRLKIRDPFLLCIPAFAYLVINTWLCVQFIR